MLLRAFAETKAAFTTAWRLKIPFTLSHLAFNLLLTAVFAPLMALTVRMALVFSGQPALADFDIAHFLLSPVGFIAGVILAGMAMMLFVTDVAFMMAVALRDKLGRASGLSDGIALVLPRMPVVLGLALQISLRIFAICAPFLAVSGAIFATRLTEFDINFYLSEHPPEFLRVVLVIGVVLAAMIVLLLWRALGWTLSLPLVLFAGYKPRDAIVESRNRMRGTHPRFFVKIVVWFFTSSVMIALTLGAIAGLTDMVVGAMGTRLSALVVVLVIMAALWTTLNLLVTSMTTGALAVMLMSRAGWPETEAPATLKLPKAVWRGGVLAGIVVSVLGLGGISDLSRVDTGQDVEVIAHRGASGDRPENTMAAITKAITDGADWVEIDVQETADGAIAVIHDSDFMKLSANPLKIWDATQADLAQIDIGSWFDPEFADERTPLLEDVLSAAKDRAGVVIELKYYGHDERLEERVIEIVEAADMVDQVKIMSLKYEALGKVRGLRPDWEVGLLASAALGKMWELDADFLAVNSATVSYRLIKEANKVGKSVYVWTVNDPLAMSGMISLGVDGLITDEPELANQVLSERREMSGAERLVLGIAGQMGLTLDISVEGEM